MSRVKEGNALKKVRSGTYFPAWVLRGDPRFVGFAGLIGFGGLFPLPRMGCGEDMIGGWGVFAGNENGMCCE